LFTVSFSIVIFIYFSYNDENNENEVARQIIQCSVPYPNFYWKNKSPGAKNFVMSNFLILNHINLIITK